MNRILFALSGLLVLGCPSQESGPPDLLVVVLDTTTRATVADAMPNSQAFLEAGLSWDLAVSPSNSTVASVASVFQDRFLTISDLAPGEDSTAETTLAEKLGAAGYSTLFVSANSALDHELFAEGFDEVQVRARDSTEEGDESAVQGFVDAWEQLPAPRFGWLQVLAGHDYLGSSDDTPWPPQTQAELEQAWTWHTDDARATDGLLPQVFDLVPVDAGLTVLTADHGELFGDRGPFMLGANFGHGEANSPMEIQVPLALQGLDVVPGLRAGPVSTLDVHRTLLAAAGLPASGDLRTDTALRPAGSSICNLLNLQVTEGGGNMSAWVLDDGTQLVRTHSPDSVPVADRPPLLARWPATGLGYQPNWEELELTDLTTEQTRFLFDESLPECKGFRDLCDEYPELEAIGYIDCD